MRIFLGLTEVSGYYANLKSGFAALGITCVHIPLQAHRFKYSDLSDQPFWGRLARACVTRRISSAWPMNLFWLAASFVTRIALFLYALLKFDIFILGGGSSFFRLYELPLLRFFRKKIIYVFHGTDARPPYVDGFFEGVPPFSQASPIPRGKALHKILRSYIKATRRRRRDTTFVERWANAVVCGPSWAQFLVNPFSNFFIIGVPIDLRTSQIKPPENPSSHAIILHAPSQHDGKGTNQIRQVVHSLRVEGFEFDYIEISGRPNSEVIDAISRSDLVVDQFYSDTPMAAFAAEAAFFGKPALVGSYYADLISKEMPQDLIPPSIFCHPDDLGLQLKRLILDPALRIETGRNAQQFVRNCWAPEVVARRFLKIIDGSAPTTWMVNPLETSYFHGIGISEDRSKQNINAIVEHYGISALSLPQDKINKLIKWLSEKA